MNPTQTFSAYFVISIGIIIFIVFPICAIINCVCCKKKRQHIYLDIP